MPKETIQFTIEDARILFRNFAGEKRRFNEDGRRNFALVLTDELAQQLAQDGWNVKYLEPQDEGDSATPFIRVNVNFRSSRPPKINVITSRGRVRMGEDTVESLDYMDIAKVDAIINGFPWEGLGGKAGISAYLQTLFAVIEEDELEKKYASDPGVVGEDD